MCLFSRGVFHSQLELVYWGQGYLEESEAKSAWKPLRIEPEYINLRARKLTFLTFTRLALEFSETRDGCHMAWIITMTWIRLWHSKKKWGKGYLISISKFWKIFHLNWCKEHVSKGYFKVRLSPEWQVTSDTISRVGIITLRVQPLLVFLLPLSFSSLFLFLLSFSLFVTMILELRNLPFDAFSLKWLQISLGCFSKNRLHIPSQFPSQSHLRKGQPCLSSLTCIVFFFFLL